MCLYGYQKKRLEAQTDLPVLKIVSKDSNSDGGRIPGLFITPYEKYVMSVPSTVTARGRYNPVWMEYGGTRRVAVSKGMIHLYRDDYDGLLQLQYLTEAHWADKDMALVRGVIPAGTLFSPGQFGEVCAKTVRYTLVDVTNTDEDDMRIFVRCKQLIDDYCESPKTNPWDEIMNKILIETEEKDYKEN